jgi:hypothetical protein
MFIHSGSRILNSYYRVPHPRLHSSWVPACICPPPPKVFTYGGEPFLRSRQLCSYSGTSQHFMGPEGLLNVHKSTPLVPTWARSSHHIYLRSILILSTHLCLGLPSGSFFLDSHQYPTCIPLLPPSCYMPYSSHSPWLDHSNYVWRGVQVMKLLIMEFYPISYHHISSDQIFSSAPGSQTPSVYVPPLIPTLHVAQIILYQFHHSILS